MDLKNYTSIDQKNTTNINLKNSTNMAPINSTSAAPKNSTNINAKNDTNSDPTKMTGTDLCLELKHEEALNYLDKKGVHSPICRCSGGRTPDATGVCTHYGTVAMSLHSETMCQFDLTWDATLGQPDSNKFKIVADIVAAGLYQIAEVHGLNWVEHICIENRPYRPGSLNIDFNLRSNGTISNSNVSQIFSNAVRTSSGRIGSMGPGDAKAQDLNECANSTMNECTNGKHSKDIEQSNYSILFPLAYPL